MRIPLSPMDYYFYRRELYTIQFIFEYNGRLNTADFSNNLSRATSVMPAIGSQIQIISNEEIVLQTGFPISLRIQEFFAEPIGSLQSETFLDPVVNTSDEPLIKILVTHTPSRSFIGFSFSHLLGDGSSFFHFAKLMSNLCLRQKVEHKTSNARELLQIAVLENSSSSSLFDSTGYVILRPANPTNFSVEILKYTYCELSELKEFCRSRGYKVTTNDILLAELAKRYHPYIPLHDNQFIIRCPVDYRSIFGLPSGYFGNAVRDAIAQLNPEEVEHLSLPEIANRIRMAVLSVNKQSVTESLVSLDRLRKTYGIGIFEQVGCPGLLVSNLSKFPVSEIDFGLGPPIGFHHASLNPRLALILPAADGVEIRFKKPLAQ